MPYSFLSMWWGLKILHVQETIETRNIYIKLVNEIRFGHFYPKANDTKATFLDFTSVTWIHFTVETGGISWINLLPYIQTRFKFYISTENQVSKLKYQWITVGCIRDEGSGLTICVFFTA